MLKEHWRQAKPTKSLDQPYFFPRLHSTKEKSRSYDDLENLVANTVAMSREAIRMSPLKHRQSNIDHAPG